MTLTRREALGGLTVALALTACTTPTDHHAAYDSFADPVAEIDAARQRAAMAGQRVLVVLGGNWCHDSKSLAARLQKAEISSAAASFQTALISVGFLDEARDAARRYSDVPIYLHTPTVLVLDADSGALLNAGDHRQFRDAARLSDADILAYLKKHAPGQPPTSWPGAEGKPAYKEQLARIDALIATQTIRLAAAYDLIGPKLAARTSDLDAHWGPVRDLRYQLADDIDRLRAELVASSGSADAAFSPIPAYPAFPWDEGSVPPVDISP